MYIRIDTVEQNLQDMYGSDVKNRGYLLSHRIIEDNLSLGLSAISDSCNTLEFVRREWESVARRSGAKFVHIEVVCSDLVEHENRAKNRNITVENLVPPSWTQIQERAYEPWSAEVITVDTAGKSVESSYQELQSKLIL